MRSWNQASESIQVRATRVLFSHYYLVTSTTNWAHIFTDLLLCAFVDLRYTKWEDWSLTTTNKVSSAFKTTKIMNDVIWVLFNIIWLTYPPVPILRRNFVVWKTARVKELAFEDMPDKIHAWQNHLIWGVKQRNNWLEQDFNQRLQVNVLALYQHKARYSLVGRVPAR